MEIPYTYARTDEEILNALLDFPKMPLVGIDTETTGLDPHTAELLLWQFSNGQSNVVIDCTVENAISKKDEASPVYRLLRDICVKQDYLKIGHNIGFDFKIIKKNLGFEMSNLYDTMIAEKILGAGRDFPTNGYQKLDVVVPKYTKITTKEMNKSLRKGFYSGYVRTGFTKEQLEYSARDVHVLQPVYWGQIFKLQQDGLVSVSQLEFDIIPAVAMMEYHGVNMDIQYWKGLLEEAEAKMATLRKEIQHYLKPLAKQKSVFEEFCEISMDSPTQLGNALRGLGLNVESTGKDILDKISGSHPILKPLLEYRNHAKFTSTYGEKLLAKINPITGRIHGSFKQCSTSTGRQGSENPNMQNVPSKQKFRRGFIAPVGFKCVGADLGGQELRILAFLSKSKGMLSAFQRGEDLHNNTTSEIYGIPLQDLKDLLQSLDRKLEEHRYDDITDEERKWKKNRTLAKSSNFLTSYGGSHFKLSQTAGIPEDEAKRIIAGLFKAYPELKTYIDVEGKKAVEQGYSLTIMKRRRYYNLPSASDSDYFKIVSSIKRQAVNHTIQGSASSMTKLAIKYAYKDFSTKFGNDNAYIWASVHDELQSMVRKDLEEEAKEVLVASMKRAFYELIPETMCPCVVDAKSGDFWIH
jgi:DNA polymerase-1